MRYDGKGGERLDLFLVRSLRDLTRSQIKRLITSGFVLVNGERAKAGVLLRTGDLVDVSIPPSPPCQLQPEVVRFDVLYEDPWVLVLNKPAGLVVHPGPGHPSGTLVHGLLAHCPAIETVGGRERAGLVHRLDKDTSGVMIVAKTPEAHLALSRQFKEHTAHKDYIALVHGTPERPSGSISSPLGRDRWDRKRISVRTRKPRTAVTHWQVLGLFEDYALLLVRPETGRTHQIRVHLACMHHPVAGDALYGPKASSLGGKGRAPFAPRQLLHAASLSIEHPQSGQRQTFRAPLPRDLAEILQVLDPTLLEKLTLWIEAGYNLD